MTEMTATNRQLWRINEAGRLRDALERCPSGIIDRETARSVLAEFMPPRQKAAEPIRPLIKELNRLEHQRRGR